MATPGGSIGAVPGISAGCWTDPVGLTGCTVVLCPQGAVVAAEARGGAPGTRETDLARPGTRVEQAQAVLLSGGSAYGLDAAAGVVRWLEERGWGFPVAGGVVPIVPAAVLFDLGVGSFEARPGPAAGYAACEAAGPGIAAGLLEGSTGAGTGCTVGKRFGLDRAMRGGQGTAALGLALGPAGVTVGALVAVNAVGDVYEPHSGRIIAGARLPDGGLAGADAWRHLPELTPPAHAEATDTTPEQDGPAGLNTTIGVVATDAPLTPEQAQRVAWMAHDGLARAIRPAHTPLDGDTLFVLATGVASLPDPLPPLALSAIGEAAAEAVAQAIVRATYAATPLPGLPAAGPDV
jgi:L-aminopeptidase/D-esterase-like protein